MPTSLHKIISWFRFSILPHLYYAPILLIIGFILFSPPLELQEWQTKLDVHENNNRSRQLVLSLAFVLAFAGLLRRPGALTTFVQQYALVLILVAYSALSIIWSTVPLVSSKRVIQFVGLLMAAACAMHSRVAPRQIIGMLRALFTISLILSLSYVLLWPEQSTHGDSGAWHGMHVHKNTLGMVGITTLVLWLPLLQKTRALSVILLTFAAIALAGFITIKSDSKSAQLSMVLLVTFWLFISLPLRWEIKIPLMPIPFLITGFWLTNLQGLHINELLVEALSRDSSLTGRTVLWGEIINNLGLHSFLGAGYNGFWARSNMHAVHLVTRLGWDPGQAHNGYLDVLNDLGIVGTFLFAMLIVHAIVLAIRVLRYHVLSAYVLTLLLVTQLLFNLTETSFCRGTTLGWCIFIITYGMLIHLHATLTKPINEVDEKPPRNYAGLVS